MATNSWWIKMDYWVQTVLGVCILITTASIFGWMIAIALLIPFGLWQFLSGLVGALRGDRLQQIYVTAASIISWLCYNNLTVQTEINLLVLILISIPIAVWKYTVIRADYISLSIIDTPQIDTTDLLDA